MTSVRKETPRPPRPPAPRLNIQRSSPTVQSMSVHFSNAESPDDPTDAVTTETPSAVEMGVDAEELMVSEAIIKADCSSPHDGNDAADDDDTEAALMLTNKLRAAQNQPPLPPPPSLHNLPSPHNEKTSFMSGIKERFQDPLNAFIGKIEEFSDKTGILEAKMGKKADESPTSPILIGENTGAGKPTKLIHQNSESSLLRASPVNGLERSPTANRPEVMKKQRHVSLDLVTDSEPGEDFLGMPTVEIQDGSGAARSFPKSCSLDAIAGQTAPHEKTPKIKTTLKKLIKPIAGRSSTSPAKSVTSPAKSSSPQKQRPVAMSLSGLLNQEADVTETSNSEADRFYDPQDDVSQSETPETAEEVSETEPLPTTETLAPKPPGHTPTTLLPSRHKLLSIFVAILAYLVVPLPTYVAGMVFGAFLATAAIFSYLWWTAPSVPREPFILPDLDSLSPLTVPEMRDSKNDQDKFKGWLNELKHYNQSDYHINQTHSVMVILEGTKLRLQTPKQNIPKRAMWDEPAHFKTSFIRQRHFDLVGAKVELLPVGLVRKRMWSKKYPVSLVIPVDLDSPPGLRGSGSPGAKKPVRIYLFARSARDKEDWFRRFEAACEGKPLPTQIREVLAKTSDFRGPQQHRRMSSSSSMEGFVHHRRQGSTDSNISDTERDFVLVSPCHPTHEQRLGDLLRYMARVIPAESQRRLQEVPGQKRSPAYLLPSPATCEPQIAWVNALVTRCFWDFLREKFWVDKIRDKIQKKLCKIHVPYFIDELTVTGIELGTEMPVIRRASQPYLDDRGLWVDLDIAYTGGFRMSLETKCNLMKLTKSPGGESTVTSPPKTVVKSPVHDSNEEDSAESSTDEEGGEENAYDADDKGGAANATGGTSKKLLRFVDKISQSKYFQKAAEYKYIKRAMEGVSNTRLLLKVELKNIAGPLAINVPHPPTDRLWYGFRQNPRLWLSAKPWVGEREVSLSHVTDWVENKLAQEFQRVFVMPNMDDIPIPIMSDNLPHPEDLTKS